MANIKDQEAGAEESARHQVSNEKAAWFNQVLCDDVMGLQKAFWKTFAEHKVLNTFHAS